MIKKAIIFLLAITSLVLVVANNYTYASGSLQINGPEIVFKDKNKLFTVEQILEMYSTVSDSKLEIISDGYTGLGNKAGIYPVTIGIRNSTENRTINIHVKNVISDYAYAASYMNGQYQLYTTKNIIIPEREIILALERISDDVQVTSKTGVIYGTNTYTENAESPGRYMYEFTLVQTSGTRHTQAVEVIVNNSETLAPDYIFTNDVFNFGDVFKNIGSYIVGIIIVIVLFLIGRAVYKNFNKTKGK